MLIEFTSITQQKQINNPSLLKSKQNMNSNYFNNVLQVALLVLFLSSTFSSAHLKLQPPPMPQPTTNPAPSTVQCSTNTPQPSTLQLSPNIPQPSTSQSSLNISQPSTSQHSPNIPRLSTPSTSQPNPNIPQPSTSQPSPTIPQPSTPSTSKSSSNIPQPSTSQPSPNIPQPSTSQPSPTIPQPSTSQHSPNIPQPSISQPSTSKSSPNISQPSISQPNSNIPQPSTSQPSPTIPQPSISQPSPNIPQSSTSQRSPTIPQPSTTSTSQPNPNIPQPSTPSTSQPNPNIPQPSTSQLSPNIPLPSTSQPTTNPQPLTPQASPSGNPSDVSINYQGTFKKVYAFGDSYSDTGNAKLMGGLKSFVIDWIKKKFALLNPNGGKELSGSRLCNGKLVIDFLCDSLGLPTPPPYKDTSANFSNGVNFAIAGSTGLSGDFFAAHKIAHSLMWKAIPETFKTQLDWFTTHLNDVECKGLSDVDCKGSMNDSLFWVGEMGGNDYSRTLGSSISIPWLTEMNIGHVFNLVKTLIERGAKYLVVQGLPPAGCCPLQLALSRFHDRDGMGCASLANGLIQAHNKLLQMKLEILRKLFPHCVITYVDYMNAYKNILSNHKQYKFQEPFKACCGAGGGLLNFNLNRLCGSVGTSTCKQPDQYINWDGVHLTEAMHKVLSDHFFHKPGFCHPSFLNLIKHKKGLLI